MQQNSSSEDYLSSTSPEILHILWNLKIHYHVHNSLPLVPLHSQATPVCGVPSCLFKVHSGNILLCFKFLFSKTRALCPTHFILDLITQITFGEQNKYDAPRHAILAASHYFLPLRLKQFLQHHILKTPPANNIAPM
jgi:hypothetical protein